MAALGRKTGGTAIQGAQVGVCSNRRRGGATQASQEAFLQEVGLGYGLRGEFSQAGSGWGIPVWTLQWRNVHMASGPGLLEAVLPRETWLWLAGDFLYLKAPLWC